MKSKVTQGIRYWAARVSALLEKGGIEVVLTGGACVSVYTRNRYQSFDLDFVNIRGVPSRQISKTLEAAAFKKEGRVFMHPDCPYAVDILSPPLSIGAEPVSRTEEMIVGSNKFHLLTPSDSVKDRLAAFYYWNDQQALEQALMICLAKRVALAPIKKWSQGEGQEPKYDTFLRLLNQRKTKGR